MRIAITGGAADGKSTVCAMLSEMGFVVASADEAVSRLYEDPEVVARVHEKLGERFVGPSGIDRDALRLAISSDANLRRTLNAIFHPAVMAEVIRATETGGVAFAEVPLLIETATQGWFDEVWVVSAGPEEQRKRLVKRLGSEAAADGLLSTQLPTAAKIPFANQVIRTNMPVETVKSTIAELVKELLEKR